MKSKYLSRKFLITILTNILAVLGAVGIQNTEIQLVCYAAMLVVNLAYMFIEGHIDKKALQVVKDAAIQINSIAEQSERNPGPDTSAASTDTEQTATLEATQATTSQSTDTTTAQ